MLVFGVVNGLFTQPLSQQIAAKYAKNSTYSVNWRLPLHWVRAVCGRALYPQRSKRMPPLLLQAALLYCSSASISCAGIAPRLMSCSASNLGWS